MLDSRYILSFDQRDHCREWTERRASEHAISMSTDGLLVRRCLTNQIDQSNRSLAGGPVVTETYTIPVVRIERTRLPCAASCC